MRAIATAHPTLRMVIAHLGQTTPSLEPDQAIRTLWQEQIELGRLPNVWFDCAALPSTWPEEGFPFASARVICFRRWTASARTR